MNFPKDLKYTETHEWVRIEGGQATIGITDFAQGELSDIVYVEITAVGKTIKRDEPIGTIEAVKAVSDLYSPVSGLVTAANDSLKDSPATVNKDPYGKGWMIKMRVDNAADLADLLDVESYKKIVAK